MSFVLRFSPTILVGFSTDEKKMRLRNYCVSNYAKLISILILLHSMEVSHQLIFVKMTITNLLANV